MHSPLQAQLAREVADRPTEARAYGAHNTAPPLFKLPAYAGVSTGMVLWTQLVVSAYGADQTMPLTDMIRSPYKRAKDTDQDNQIT